LPGGGKIIPHFFPGTRDFGIKAATDFTGFFDANNANLLFIFDRCFLYTPKR